MVGIAVGIIVGIWYPSPMYQIQGLLPILMMLIGIDLILGPLLTLLVYKPAKPSLRFDLTVIILLQLSAMIYGIHSTFIARPVYTVFFGDRFEVVTASEYDAGNLKKIATHPYVQFPVMGPHWVGAVMPADAKEKERVMFSAVAGGGLKMEPQYYVSYDKIKLDAAKNGKRVNDVLSNAKNVDALTEQKNIKKPSQEQIASLIDWINTFSVGADKIVLVPMKGTPDYATVALHADTGDILGAKAIDPWWY